jgi:hypothetical protein
MAKNEINVEINQVISLANNETVLQTFEGFEVVDPVGKGYFTITNQRLVYYATFRDKLSNSITVRECPIDSIGEIASEYGKRTSKLQKTIGLIIFLIGLAVLIYGSATYIETELGYRLPAFIIGGVFFLIGLIVILTSKRKMFTLEIFTKTSRSSIVSLTSDFFQSPNRGRIKIKPNNQTIQMIKELGKYIIEARNRRF